MSQAHCSLCIHGHFYQPPRTDPFTGRIPREPDAAPYDNWNERITAECYDPLSQAGCFGQLSFNLGGTLIRWMVEHAPATYERIVASEHAYYAAHQVTNGLAQPVHHTILPLARRRDKICQVRWGIASFVHHLGHIPLGMWLPEMAVDVETLDVLAAEGIAFVILSDEQVRGDLTQGAGPYWVALPQGRRIAVFVRDRHLSNTLSFEMPPPDGVHAWLDQQINWRCHDRRLVLIATDGETFGHHHRQGIEVLRQIVAAEPHRDYRLTTLGLYLRQNPPQTRVKVIENSSWSCSHGLDRWLVGCGCTPGDGRWKGALRRALDNLASDLDAVYVQEACRLGRDPWALRDGYIVVQLGQIDGATYLRDSDLGHLDNEATQRLLWLLEAQFYRQRMYASCTFFFEDLDRHEPRYALANAILALALTRYATGDDLSHGFRRDLSVVVSGRTERRGIDLFDELLRSKRK